MGILNELLQTAYTHMDAGNPQSARAILDSLVNIDPTNPEVWEACMQISDTCEELDRLCDRMLKTPGILPNDRESILEYYYFLRQKLRIKRTGGKEPKMITFELVDEFSYTLKSTVEKKPDASENDHVEQGLAWWLGKGILLVYLALFAVSLQLIHTGNDFGYWIILTLALSMFFNLWNTLTHAEQNPNLSNPKLTKSSSPIHNRKHG
jgi:hypothetical protein